MVAWVIRCMDGWVDDGWMDGLDKWVNGWMEGLGGWIYGWMDGFMD